MIVALWLLWLFATVILVSLTAIVLNNVFLSLVEKICMTSFIVFCELGITLLIVVGMGMV